MELGEGKESNKDYVEIKGKKRRMETAAPGIHGGPVSDFEQSRSPQAPPCHLS